MSDEWMRDALCRNRPAMEHIIGRPIGDDEDLFFPPQGVEGTEAKQVCAECPVRTECYEDALEHRSLVVVSGVRAGVTYKELVAARRRLYRADANYRQAECGTYAGYRRHYRMGTRMCQPCRDAAAAYKRERRAS